VSADNISMDAEVKVQCTYRSQIIMRLFQWIYNPGILAIAIYIKLLSATIEVANYKGWEINHCKGTMPFCCI